MKLPKYLLPLSAAGTAFGLVVLFKDSAGGPKFEGKERITGRTVIVTGATSGLGKEIASDLAKRGGRVIMACRDMEKCEQVRQQIIKDSFNTNVHCKDLNLASLKSVRKFAQDINQNEKRLDILVNNAGVMCSNGKRSITEDGFELHLGVNYLSQFLLTKLLVDKLEASAPSRVIMTTSVGYENARIRFSDLNADQAYSPEGAYKQSKLAVAMCTRELARQLKDRGISVNAVNPGLVETNLRADLGMNRSWISGVVLRPLWFLMFKTPAQGAQSALYAALEPSIAEHTGCLYGDCQEIPFSATALNEATNKRLYLTSERWTE